MLNYRTLSLNKVIELEEIANITMGQSPKSDTYNLIGNGLPLLNGASDFRHGIKPLKFTTNPKKVVKKGDLIFGIRATLGLVNIVDDTYAIGRGTGAISPKITMYTEYLYSYLTDFFGNSISEFSNGSVFSNITKSDLQNLKLRIPIKSDLMEFHQNNRHILELTELFKKENETLELLKKHLINTMLIN